VLAGETLRRIIKTKKERERKYLPLHTAVQDESLNNCITVNDS
jgi:hypothetical protein